MAVSSADWRELKRRAMPRLLDAEGCELEAGN
jgi:hypothetical protein